MTRTNNRMETTVTAPESADKLDDALLPCPFCGGAPSFRTGAAEGVHGGHFIECGKCNASTALVFPLKDDVKREITERWNARAVRPESGALEGWTLVPTKPTAAMIEAAAFCLNGVNLHKAAVPPGKKQASKRDIRRYKCAQRWWAMIAAAPQVPGVREAPGERPIASSPAAAAPDLLDACKAMLALLDSEYPPSSIEAGYWPTIKPIIENARAAIALSASPLLRNPMSHTEMLKEALLWLKVCKPVVPDRGVDDTNRVTGERLKIRPLPEVLGQIIREIEALLALPAETVSTSGALPPYGQPVTKDGPLGGWTTLGQESAKLDFILTQFENAVEAAIEAITPPEEAAHQAELAHKLKREIIEKYTPRLPITPTEELIRLAVSALNEAEAILGGEYGDQYGHLCETMCKLESAISASGTRP